MLLLWRHPKPPFVQARLKVGFYTLGLFWEVIALREPKLPALRALIRSSYQAW